MNSKMRKIIFASIMAIIVFAYTGISVYYKSRIVSYVFSTDIYCAHPLYTGGLRLNVATCYDQISSLTMSDKGHPNFVASIFADMLFILTLVGFYYVTFVMILNKRFWNKFFIVALFIAFVPRWLVFAIGSLLDGRFGIFW